MTAAASLSGQVALVTGGAVGIGLACVERLAAEGARVALVDCDAETGTHAAARLRGGGQEVVFTSADVTAEDDVARAFDEVIDRWERLDVLVNGAGGFTRAPRLQDLDRREWDALIALNLSSAYLCCRRAAGPMTAAGYGRIVNVASMASRTAVPHVSHAYTAAKTGLVGLTRSLALEFAPFGITVNAVAPGVVLSPRVSRLHADRLDEIVAATPMGRVGTAEEMADAVWYLSSSAARYITGITLDVNGGRYVP